MANYTSKKQKRIAALCAAALLLAGCTGKGKIVDPGPTATPAVAVEEGSFADGRLLSLGFRLLYAADSGGNKLVNPSGLATVMAAAKLGAGPTTDEALNQALGAQTMEPKDVEEMTQRLRQGLTSLQKGMYASAWGLFIGEQQAVKEDYLTNSAQDLALPNEFQQLEGEDGDKYLSSWADDATGGKVKEVSFKMPKETQPVFVDIFAANPDWQRALDPNKTKPLPFTYDNGEEKAIPTLVLQQKCGVYDGLEGSVAILPTAGDEARLIILVPSKEISLHDFLPVAVQHHDDWLKQAEWGDQRVLLPRFELGLEGSEKTLLNKSGFSGLLDKGADYSGMGNGLYFSDVYGLSQLVVDESGVDQPDPAANYNPGVNDDVPTFAVDRPFVVLLERTDTGQLLAAGVVRDPLAPPKE